MRRGNILVLILLLVLVLISLIGSVFAIASFRFSAGGLAKGGGGSGSGGCYLEDRFFTDTSLADQPEETFNRLSAEFTNAKEVKSYVLEILTEGKKRGINPAMPLSVWNGEQGFRNPEKAFGYGFRDRQTPSQNDTFRTWATQLDGVYKTLRDAIDNRGYYTKPEGANIFTRFYYNYTTALRQAYDRYGSWDDRDSHVRSRLAVLRLLVPSQISCDTPGTIIAGSASGDGNDGVPMFRQCDQRWSSTVYGDPSWGRTICSSGCCPTAAAMILRFYGVDVDPAIMADYAYRNGYYKGNGTITGPFVESLKSAYGLKRSQAVAVSPDSKEWGRALDFLKSGRPLMVSGKGPDPFTKGGHCIVVTSYNETQGTVLVNNPARGRGDGPFPFSTIKNNAYQVYYIEK